MTTPSDPNQPGEYSPYGDQQSGLPRFPSAPPPMEGETRTITPPTEITVAFWCYIVAAVVTVVGGLMVLGARQQIMDAVRSAGNGGNLTPQQLDAAANLAIGLAVVLSLVFAGLYVLFAFKLRAGRNWARIVLTIVAVLELLSLVTSNGGGSALRYIGDLAAIIGAVLSYLPNSNAYFATVKRNG
jgi:hypothetical protein